jgi:hypothetical protein
MSHKSSWVGAACCALALSVGAAKAADTITTFDVSATFVSSGYGSCPGCKLHGHIIINTTTGAILSENVTMTQWSGGLFSLIQFTSRPYYPSLEWDGLLLILWLFDNWRSPTTELQLVLPVKDTLVGYTGGPICSQVVKCINTSLPWWSGVWSVPWPGVLLGYVDLGSLKAVRSQQVPATALRWRAPKR